MNNMDNTIKIDTYFYKDLILEFYCQDHLNEYKLKKNSIDALEKSIIDVNKNNEKRNGRSCSYSESIMIHVDPNGGIINKQSYMYYDNNNNKYLTMVLCINNGNYAIEGTHKCFDCGIENSDKDGENTNEYFKLRMNKYKFGITVTMLRMLCIDCTNNILEGQKYTKCSGCHISEKSNKILRCSLCKSTYYCSKDCQINNWDEHKKLCKTTAKKKID